MINKKLLDLYYKKGDIETIPIWSGGGYLTTGKTQIIYSIPLPKYLDNISNVEIISGTTTCRSVSGNNLLSGQSIFTYNPTISINHYKNLINICLTYSASQFANFTNNTPLGIQLTNLKFQFN